MRLIVLMPGPEYFAAGVSLTALTARVHSDGAIPPERNRFLQMHQQATFVVAKRFIQEFEFKQTS
jgi:hypothetical protein